MTDPFIFAPAMDKYWYLEHISSGKRFILQTGENKVGRSSKCSILIKKCMHLSRMHAKITVTPDNFIGLEKIESHNVVYINDIKLTEKSCALFLDDKIGLGVVITKQRTKEVPANKAIFILKHSRIADDDTDLISDALSAEITELIVEDNNNDTIVKQPEAVLGLNSEIKKHTIDVQKKNKLLSQASKEIICGEHNEELLEPVVQINPIVYKQSNNNNLPIACRNNLCGGDVIELHEKEPLRRKVALTIEIESGTNDFVNDDEFIFTDEYANMLLSKVTEWSTMILHYNKMSQVYQLEEQKNRSDIENKVGNQILPLTNNNTENNNQKSQINTRSSMASVVQNSDNGKDSQFSNLVTSCPVNSNVATRNDEDEFIVVDDDNSDDLFRKIAEWSSKIPPHNKMSQADHLEEEKERAYIKNKVGNQILPMANNNTENNNHKSQINTRSSKALVIQNSDNGKDSQFSNLVTSCPVKSNLATYNDEDEFIVVDDDNSDDLFRKIAEWSSKIPPHNKMSQVDQLEEEKERSDIENKVENQILPMTNDDTENNDQKSKINSRSSKVLPIQNSDNGEHAQFSNPITLGSAEKNTEPEAPKLRRCCVRLKAFDVSQFQVRPFEKCDSKQTSPGTSINSDLQENSNVILDVELLQQTSKSKKNGSRGRKRTSQIKEAEQPRKKKKSPTQNMKKSDSKGGTCNSALLQLRSTTHLQTRTRR